jgi:cysteinyl-tRNA synthetase
MSKSLGNFFTIRDVLKKYDAEVVRFFILRAHYRSPLNYSDAHLDDARQALTRLYTALKAAPTEAVAVDWNEAHAQRFQAAMDDDFNTPEALAVLFDLANEVNRSKDGAVAAQLKALAGVLGLLTRSPEDYLKGRVVYGSGNAGMSLSGNGEGTLLIGGGISESDIEARIQARVDAKKAKNFAEADRLRAELLAAGIVLEDSAQGTTWRRA